MAKPESPSEPFKRAVTVAVRSLAAEPELEVNFSSEPPSLKGLKARLPSPHRNLSAQDIALVRGTGDAYALRKAYHDEKINNQFRPASPEGAAVFEAAEQARVEAIGSLAMKGVAANLTAGLEQRLLGRGLAKARVKDDAPLADVLGLMVREKLTGEKPPASVAAAVDMWRPMIEAKAGADLDKLAAALRDQKAYARLTRTMLNHLALGDQTDRTHRRTRMPKAKIPKARMTMARTKTPSRRAKARLPNPPPMPKTAKRWKAIRFPNRPTN